VSGSHAARKKPGKASHLPDPVEDPFGCLKDWGIDIAADIGTNSFQRADSKSTFGETLSGCRAYRVIGANNKADWV
jgi:hypothetical protein